MIFIKIKTFKTNFYFIKKISFGKVLIESKALYTHVYTQIVIYNMQYIQEMFKKYINTNKIPNGTYL